MINKAHNIHLKTKSHGAPPTKPGDRDLINFKNDKQKFLTILKVSNLGDGQGTRGMLFALTGLRSNDLRGAAF